MTTTMKEVTTCCAAGRASAATGQGTLSTSPTYWSNPDNAHLKLPGEEGLMAYSGSTTGLLAPIFKTVAGGNPHGAGR